ncbi:MAG TPA: DUF3795 domain-containing protein [Bacteroidales bacterium]|nr:DUF3795 domain-containing protein [Bacteroidales bacterium]
MKRREFISCGYKGGIACGILLAGNLNAFALSKDEKPDVKKLNYCGYQCPADCKVKKATVENNLELKKEVYKEWRIKEKYNFEFDAESMFCWGCKTEGKPLGVITNNCSVRACAIDKGYDSCIQCKDLTTCEKEIWKTFPKFKESMLELQKKFFS